MRNKSSPQWVGLTKQKTKRESCAADSMCPSPQLSNLSQRHAWALPCSISVSTLPLTLSDVKKRDYCRQPSHLFLTVSGPSSCSLSLSSPQKNCIGPHHFTESILTTRSSSDILIHFLFLLLLSPLLPHGPLISPSHSRHPIGIVVILGPTSRRSATMQWLRRVVFEDLRQGLLPYRPQRLRLQPS